MILVVAEHINSNITQETYETLAFAFELSSKTGMEIFVLFPGKDIKETANKFFNETGINTIIADSDNLEYYSMEAYTHTLNIISDKFNPSFICIPHTATGSDYSPYLSIKLDADCITAVNGISEFKEGIGFSRLCWHGKIKADYKPQKNRTIITVFPGSFKWNQPEKTQNGKSISHKINIQIYKTISVSIIKIAVQKTNLKDADVIISAGNGIKKIENLELLKNLASCFSRSAIAGSRIACDKGWLDYGLQVGMTGQKVSPKLYIACGISGTMQHVSGITGSDFIIAINRDKDAPIFQYADVAVVENLEKFIPIFIEMLNRKNE